MSHFFGYSHIHEKFFMDEGELMQLKSSYPLVWSYDDIAWVFFLKSGMVKASLQTGDTRNALIGFFQPGMTFAQSGSFFSMKTMRMDYETMTPCDVYRIPQESFWKQIQKDPEFSEEYMRLVLKYNLILIDRIGYQNEHGLKNKIILWLRFMVKYYGETIDDHCTINIPLTQEMISDFIHCSRESISLTFNELQEENIITVSRKIITINSLEKLNSL